MSRTHRAWLAILVAVALLRLVTLSAYPLADTTESRYAEIARIMVTSGNWVTPQIEPGVPFWAKPPLSIWLTAVSFKLFGISEFAARLPAFLLTLLTALIMYRVAPAFVSKDAAIAGVGVFLTSVMGFIVAGAVQTDASLLLATTISMLAFLMAVVAPKSPWRYVFFVGIGIGLLAKGPIAVVLVGMPILAWSLWFKDLPWLLRALPWVSGSIVVLLIAGPWYWLAETRTPGFLNYYLVGEHWLRFIETGWSGDLYGNAHAHPRGSIWLYGIAAALPWSLLAIFALGRLLRRRQYWKLQDPIGAYLGLWMLGPLVFFTMSGNILATYVLPGIPGFALLLGAWLDGANERYVRLGWIVPVVIVAAMATHSFDRVAEKSERDLIRYHTATHSGSDLFYFVKIPYSASFYSAGQAGVLQNVDELEDFLQDTGPGSIAMRTERVGKLSPSTRSCLRITRVIHRYTLMEKWPGNNGCIITE